ncbi:TetR/AcrR family transcriptional regulator [Aquabacterium lacunae]|uniref:TetR/AcrR family transcriptional regulator n=1 Tax=Aquabacterium lacunae TaxID=2528630 RepID=A0A4Q9H3V2_9BURK|nr:TetR/AcrR family transcriptional regulator [Aquabacterium lacunae]
MSNKTPSPTKRPVRQATGARLAPDARRAHLLSVGAAAFGAHAYDDVQIDQIAQQAGVSRGLLYHYFPGKQEFFAAIVEDGYDDILRVTLPDPALPPLAQLQASLEAYFDHVAEHPHTYRALFRSAASAHQGVQAVVQRNLDTQAQRIMVALAPMSPPSPLLTLSVRAWLAFLVHAALDWLDSQPPLDRQAVIRACTAALVGAVGGVGGVPPGT